MNNNRIELSKYRMEQGKNYVHVAKKLFDDKEYKSSINRAYYAVYHSIRAIFALDEIDFKTHKSVINNFNINYVRTNIFPEDVASKVGRLKYIRESSDYNDFFVISRNDAFTHLESAEYIIPLIETHLNNRYAELGQPQLEQ